MIDVNTARCSGSRRRPVRGEGVLCASTRTAVGFSLDLGDTATALVAVSAGGVAFDATNVAVDQRIGELLLPAHELEAVRLEFLAARVALVQRLSLCDEHADRILYAFDASHRRASSRLG
jgi:hypothetical protein